MSSVLTINGTDYDATGRRTAKIRIVDANPAPVDGYATMSFRVYSRTLQAPPYPYDGQSVLWKWNGTVRFRGEVVRVEVKKDHDRKYAYICHCMDLKRKADRYPVRDEQTGTSVVTFNARKGDPYYLASRAGRTVGQCAVSVLEMATNKANLAAAGLSSRPGSGASATATLTGGSVTSISVVNGGSSYDSSNKPTILLVGGQPSTPATVTGMTITGGAITAITFTGGSGYRYTPQVVISSLPAVTVSDLLKLDIIPPFPCVIQGERLLDAIESFIKGVYYNHYLFVDPIDSSIRVFDLAGIERDGTRINFAGGGGVGAVAYAITDPLTGTISSVAVIDGGRDYTGAPTTTAVGTGSGAVLSASVSGGKVTGVTVTNGGTGYSEYRKIVLTQGVQPFDPIEFQRNHDECHSRVEVRGKPLIEPTELSTKAGTLLEYFDHDGLNTAQAKSAWRMSDADTPGRMPGAAIATATLTGTSVDTSYSSIVNPGYGGTAGTYALTFSGGGGSGATGTYTVSGGKVTSVSITAGGTSYTSTPTVGFGGSSGIQGATVVVRLTGTSVASLLLVSGGNGYGATAPVLAIDPPPSGTTATGTTSVGSGVVSGVTLTGGGTGYRTAPGVRIQGPGTSYCDFGTCTVVDTTHVTITSDDATRAFAANAYDQTPSGQKGYVSIVDSVGTGILATFGSPVLANTAMTPGGTSTLTLENPLPTTSFTGPIYYSLRGTMAGGNVTWKRYRPANAALRSRMSNEQFTYDYALLSSGGAAASLTNHNVGLVCYSDTGSPPYREQVGYFTVDPDSGWLDFDIPTPAFFGTPSRLITGGDQIDGVPSDVRVVVGIYKDTLNSVYPADVASVPQYSGTSYSVEGISRTLTVYCQDWTEPSQSAQVAKYAEQIHRSVCDTVVEGQLTYYGVVEALLMHGTAVSVAAWMGTTLTTGLEGIYLPCRQASVRWPDSGGWTWVMNPDLSNRRASYTAQPMVSPPSQEGFKFGATDIWNPYAVPGNPADDAPGHHGHRADDYQEGF